MSFISSLAIYNFHFLVLDFPIVLYTKYFQMAEYELAITYTTIAVLNILFVNSQECGT